MSTSNRYQPDRPEQCPRCKAGIKTLRKRDEEERVVTFTCGTMFSHATDGNWLRLTSCRLPIRKETE